MNLWYKWFIFRKYVIDNKRGWQCDLQMEGWRDSLNQIPLPSTYLFQSIALDLLNFE